MAHSNLYFSSSPVFGIFPLVSFEQLYQKGEQRSSPKAAGFELMGSIDDQHLLSPLPPFALAEC